MPPLPPPDPTPTLGSVISDAIATALQNVRTSLPGVVQDYNPQTQRATILPASGDAYYDDTGTRIPVVLPALQNVPVLFLGGANWWLTHPVSAGDTGMVFFCSSSTDKWDVSPPGAVVDPGDDRHHHLSDAVFVCGLRQSTNPLEGGSGAATDAWVLHGQKILLGSKNASSFIALLSTMTEFMTVLATVTDSAGACAALHAALVAANWPGNYVATKVKAE